MAAPFKRLYCEVARSGSSTIRRRAAPRSSSETRQWLHSSPLSNASIFAPTEQRHHRTYSTTAPYFAPRPTSNLRQDAEPAEMQSSEPDVEPEYLLDETELSSTGHAELEQHREIRAMVRTAAWEMPLLTPLAKPFQPPDARATPLRWRYTTYLGDAHPAANKVVVEFRVADLPDLTDAQRQTLRKLVGARRNPATDVVRMNCESFASQAQNKRYLGDTIGKLLAEVRDPAADAFEDVPLDTRHYTPKKRLEFPEGWKLNPERRARLEEKRKALLLEGAKAVEEDAVVSGIAAIEVARQLKLEAAEEQPAKVETKRSSR